MKMNFRLLALVTAFILMFAVFTGCAPQTKVNDVPTTPTPAPAATSALMDKDTIVIGVDDTYPPMEFVDDTAKAQIGFDIDFATALYADMGKKVKFESNNWDGIFAALDTKKFDCIISSVSLTTERQEKFAMTKPYIANKQVLVTAPKTTGIDSLEALKGKKVAAQSGTTSDDLMVETMKTVKDIKFSKYNSVMETFDELKLGRVDAVLVDFVVAKYYVAKDPSKYKVAWESTDKEPIGVCFRKDDAAFRDKVNATIDKLYANGKMKEISDKWFKEDITVIK